MLFGIILRRNFRTWIIRTAHYFKKKHENNNKNYTFCVHVSNVSIWT